MLIGERVKLVAADSKNIPVFLKWFNDMEILQYVSGYGPLTREAEEEWFASLKDRKNTVLFSIVVKADEILIGNCSFEIDWKNRVGLAGIVIGEKEYHNKGYGTESLKLMIQYAFDELNLNRMELEVYSHNPRAKSCYEKVGFKQEGKRRQAIFKNGRYQDAIGMGLLKEEWEKKK